MQIGQSDDVAPDMPYSKYRHASDVSCDSYIAARYNEAVWAEGKMIHERSCTLVRLRNKG